jgi:hypothetical protein
MSGIASAVIVGGVVAAGATIYAANKAAGATRDASNAAITEQQRALDQQAALSKPYRDLGTSNIQTYQQLLTGGGGPNAGANIQQTLANTPGYQATMDTGVEAAKRSSAASGLNLSGNQIAGVESFGAQLGNSTYQQQLNNLLQPIQLGQAAAAGQAANVGTSASNIGNLQMQQGYNSANITSNEVAGLTRAASGAANNYLTYNTLQGLNNPGTTPGATGVGNFDGSMGTGAAAPTYTAADAAVTGFG